MPESNKQNRLLQIKAELKNIGVKHPEVSFLIKFPEMNNDTFDLMWSGEVSNDSFMEKLESFLKFKKTEFDGE